MANHLMTRWGRGLNPDNVLQEYPRPQFVRDSYFNLNGYWQYAITKNSERPANYDGQILVPFSPECPLSGVERVVAPDDYLHYCRSFTLPADFNKGRVFLHFGAVDQVASVWLNGAHMADHEGGYVPFTVDITSAVKEGENELLVVVRDFSDTSYYARGKQKFKRGGIWYSPQSGIWQTVWIESAPENCLESIKITPDYDNASVKIDFCSLGEPQRFHVDVLDGGNVVADGDGTAGVTIPLPDFKSWSPENPFLYDLRLIGEHETITSYFGMRKFSVGQDSQGVPRLFLNNKPYFHNGVLDQGYYPDGFLTPPSDEAMLFDIKAMKEMGFNMLRKHIKLEPMRWYYYCDKLGMLVWQDMVNGGGAYGLEVSVWPFIGVKIDDTKYKNFDRVNPAGRKQFIEETKTTVKALYNVPSIAMWVPFNEGWGQFDAKKMHALVKKLDPTRTVDHASGWHDQGAGDVISKHIYFTPIKVKQYDIPYALSEFGGLGLKIPGHTFNDKMFGYKIYKSKESIGKAFAKLYKKVIIPQISTGLSATVYTQLTDVEDELNGFYTYDREICKFSVEEIAAINKEVKCRG